MKMYGEPFLRSINLQFDAEEPNRISHYVPTAKCVPLIQSLLGKEDERAFFIVAPYGSGKSLTALYLLHLIEKQTGAESILQDIEAKLKDVNSDLAKYASNRRRNQKRGLTVCLHGHVASIPRAIKEGIIASLKRVKFGREANSKEIAEAGCSTMDEASQFLSMIRQKFSGKGVDRVTILWDEFGKHLETLLVEGRPTELLNIQTLAEVVNRSRNMPMTLGLFLHQGLLHYAGSMSQTVRSEWTKIEGRFRTIQYVDDSKELYRLIGDVVSSRIGNVNSLISNDKLNKAAENIKNLGLFTDFSKDELVRLFEKTYPLAPTTVYLLPRISARVAQNERTLFNFIYSCPFDTEVSPWHLFDYFAPQMRADIAVGGTYRQWLETQSAISKVGDDLPAIQALKTACLLGLGVAGDRSRTGRELLRLALAGYSDADNNVQNVIDDLISRNLLLYRRHNDEISIWHGTDLDLRGRLEEEKQRQRGNFDLLEFLSAEAQPNVWRPNEYNSAFGVRRYFLSEYHTIESIKRYLDPSSYDHLLPDTCDGKVLYLTADNPEDLKAGRKLVTESNWNERLVIAIPREPVPLMEAALEVFCLGKLQLDSELVGTDPMALPEIEQMTEDARNHLDKMLGNFLNPSSNGPKFYNLNVEKSCTSASDFRRYLSTIMLNVYRCTPIIHNELIVRKKVPGTIVNSRKKLLIGILERSGKYQLGLQGNFPDYSMFRTVLLNTGIYQQLECGEWGYVSPNLLSDSSPGMKKVWELFQKFFTESTDEAKSPAPLFETLRNPPYGVRDGLFPILFAAAYKAFPQAITIRFKGSYLEDLQPSDIESLCKSPGLYQVEVFRLDDARKKYLELIFNIFHGNSETFYEKDLIRKCFEALESWLGGLPSSWETTRKLSIVSKNIRDAIAVESDPVPLFFKKLPKAIGTDLTNIKIIEQRLLEFKGELEGIVVGYQHAAEEIIRSALALGKSNGHGVLMATCARWAQCFADDFVKSLPDGIASGLISRMNLKYGSESAFIDSISTLLIGEGLSDWDDGTEFVFDRELRSVVKRVEDYALTAKCDSSVQGDATDGVAQLAEGRLIELTDKLLELAGQEKTKSILRAILARIG